MYRIKYVTATGVHYTPPSDDLLLLKSWIRYLNKKIAIPHFIEPLDKDA